MADVGAPRNTPYQRLKNSGPVQFAKDHPIATAGAAAGPATFLGGAAIKSEVARKIALKGAIPAAGAAVAAVGGLMLHDAFVNDLGRPGKTAQEAADSKDTPRFFKPVVLNSRALGKAALGGAMLAGGGTVAAESFGIGVIKHIQPQHVLGGGAMTASAAFTGLTIADAAKHGIDDGHFAMATLGTAGTAGAAILTFAKADDLARFGDDMAAGVGPRLGKTLGAVLGTGVASYGIYRAAKTGDYYRKGEPGKLVANGFLAAGSVFGGLALVGEAAGLAVQRKVIEAAVKNPLMAAGALVTAGAGTYIYLKNFGPQAPASQTPAPPASPQALTDANASALPAAAVPPRSAGRTSGPQAAAGQDVVGSMATGYALGKALSGDADGADAAFLGYQAGKTLSGQKGATGTDKAVRDAYVGYQVGKAIGSLIK